MARVLRSLFYRLLHNKKFYIITGLLLVSVAAIFLFGQNSQVLMNHTEQHVHNHNGTLDEVYVNYEEEDPLVINKLTQNIYMGIFPCVPGQTYIYQPSIYNAAVVSTLLSIVIILIFAADGIVVFSFFGDMFSDDAIRNMITVKTRKETIYISSIIINICVIIFMYITVFAVMALIVLTTELYPIIYFPAFISAVLTGLIVTVALSSLFILILFMSQNEILAFIFSAMLVVLTWTCFSMALYPGRPFETPYQMDENQASKFLSGGYSILGDKEWYFPVDDFRIGRVYVPEDDITFDFASDKPNKYYTGDKMSNLGKTLFRSNIMYYPCEMLMWNYYPMYRDGLLTRYTAVSAGYLILLLTAGSYCVYKRNIN